MSFLSFLFQVLLILLCGEFLKKLQNRQQQHAKFKWSLFNGKLEKRLTIYEYLLNYCIVQTDGEKVWMWLTKGEGKKEGRQNRVAQDIWSLVHNQVSLARTSLLGSLENYITMRLKKIWSQIWLSTILWFYATFSNHITERSFEISLRRTKVMSLIILDVWQVK